MDRREIEFSYRVENLSWSWRNTTRVTPITGYNPSLFAPLFGRSSIFYPDSRHPRGRSCTPFRRTISAYLKSIPARAYMCACSFARASSGGQRLGRVAEHCRKSRIDVLWIFISSRERPGDAVASGILS